MTVNTSSRAEAGNVLIYILVAVILLAALSYAVSESMRGNVQQLSDERARLMASEIIEYGNTMASAVSQLRLRGVDETALCFDDTGWGNADYTHAGCTDNYNRIYHLSGGGLIWSQPPTDAMDSAATPDNLWHIYGGNEIDEMGSTCGADECADLLLVVDELQENVCLKINDALSVTNPSDAPPTETSFDQVPFDGTFSYVKTLGVANGSPLKRASAACFQKTTAPAEYVFFKVLLAR